jgi:hypothetical protein
MEEQMEKLRKYLTERYHLTEEWGKLLRNEPNIIDPERYLDCKTRLDIVKTRLCFLELQIPFLSQELCAKRNVPVSTDEANQTGKSDTSAVNCEAHQTCESDTSAVNCEAHQTGKSDTGGIDNGEAL